MKSKINSEVFAKENQSKGSKLSLKKIFGFSLTLVILAGIIWYGLSKVNHLKENWDVIQFSLEKPSLVRTLKTDYVSQSAELEKSMFKKAPTPQDKLIEEVVDQLKTSKP